MIVYDPRTGEVLMKAFIARLAMFLVSVGFLMFSPIDAEQSVGKVLNAVVLVAIVLLSSHLIDKHLVKRV